MFFNKSANQANYLKSNRIAEVKIPFSDEAIFLANKLCRDGAPASLDASQGRGPVATRQKLGEALLDELCDAARLDIIKLKISDTNQYHKKRGGKVMVKRYGLYRPGNNYIYIQNLTAVRGQILASKTFLDTLLHEWLHHYDTYKLKLRSIHSKGFYLRFNDLKNKLHIPRQKQSHH